MSASAPNTSAALALELEELLEGRGFVRKAASGSLLTGLGARLTRASALPSRGVARESLPTGVETLDRLLSGGLPRGGFVEVVARRSSGRFSLAIAALAAATSCGETAALVDVGGHLDPQSAQEAGVDLERLLWVRPEKLKHAVAAAEMLLATGFALVVVDLGVPPVRGRFVPDAAWVRLERAARDRGAALLLLSPYRVGATAEAVVVLDAAQPAWRGERRAPAMLSGIGARMTLQKDAAAKEGARGELRLSMDPVLDVLRDAHPSGPAAAVVEAAPSRRDIGSISEVDVSVRHTEAIGSVGAMDVSVRHPESRSAGGLPNRNASTSSSLPPSPCPSAPAARVERGSASLPRSSGTLPLAGNESAPPSSTVVGAAPAAAPSRRGVGGVGFSKQTKPSTSHPESRSAEGSPTRRAKSDLDPGILRFAQDDGPGPQQPHRGETRPIPSPPAQRGERVRVREASTPPHSPQDDHIPCNPAPTDAVLPHGDGMAPFDPPSPIPGEGGIFFPPSSAPYAAAPVQLSLLP